MPDAAVKSTPASQPPAVAEQHILCVDDDPNFLKSLEFFLPGRINAQVPRSMWYRFLFFGNPREALETLRELIASGESVAMVISDQMMPEMKGTQFLSEAQKVSGQSIRVLLTGHAGIESAVLAINERLLDKYLTKPIEDEHDFAVSIQHLLQRFEMQRTIAEQSAVITDLYQFANTLNGIAALGKILDSIAAFTARALQCEQAFALVVDASGSPKASAIGTAGGLEGALDRAQIGGEGSSVSVGANVQFVAGHAELAGQGFNAEEAIRRGVQFPLLLATLSADGEAIGVVGAAGRPAGRPFGDHERRTLSYIVDTASIAVRKQRAHEKLQGAYSEIHRHVESLAEANRRLRILDDLRGQFLTFISHELATPLSMIAGVDMLQEGGQDSRLTPVVQAVRRGYERLREFVQKSLMYFTWLSRDPAYSNESVDLAEVFPAVLQERADARHDQVSFVRPEGPCWALIPKEALGEVLAILLDNALKFSKEDAAVGVTLRVAPDVVALSVEDQGRGFPPEWASELFRPFTVADTDHHQRGSALNLATAAAILHAYRGSIEASSPGWDRGATFTIRIPAATGSSSRAAPTEAR